MAQRGIGLDRACSRAQLSRFGAARSHSALPSCRSEPVSNTWIGETMGGKRERETGEEQDQDSWK